jgi:hypothetical protein
MPLDLAAIRADMADRIARGVDGADLSARTVREILDRAIAAEAALAAETITRTRVEVRSVGGPAVEFVAEGSSVRIPFERDAHRALGRHLYQDVEFRICPLAPKEQP